MHPIYSNVFFDARHRSLPAAGNIIDQLPVAYRMFACNLMRGGEDTYGDFVLSGYAQSAPPKMALFRRVKRELLWARKIMRAAAVSRVQFRELYDQSEKGVDLRKEQKPRVAWFGCSDSRFRVERLLHAPAGAMLVARNPGGQITDAHDPETPSEEAKGFIALAHRQGIPILTTTAHGRCAAVGNARHCVCCLPLNDKSSEGDKAFARLHDTLHHIVKAVELKGVQYYLDLAGNPALDNIDREPFALELAHCLHNRRVADNYIKKHYASDMQVIAVHTDQRTLTSYIFNPESERFIGLPSRFAARRPSTTHIRAATSPDL